MDRDTRLVVYPGWLCINLGTIIVPEVDGWFAAKVVITGAIIIALVELAAYLAKHLAWRW